MSHAARAHSRLGASSSDRWMNCPGSVRLSAQAGEQASSSYAREGTAAHQMAEWCLKHNCDALDYGDEAITVEGEEFPVTEEMIDAVQLYLDTVREAVGDDGALFFEQRLSLAHIDEELFGTADAAIWQPKRNRLVVVDLKYGKGKAVEVEGNSQFLYYAVGADRELRNSGPNVGYRGVAEIELVVVQPRAPHKGGPVRRWVIPSLDMVDWIGVLQDAAKATRDPDAPLNAGDWCKFCPAAGFCPALRAKALEAARAEFGGPDEPITLPSVTTMPPDLLKAVLDEADVIKTWLKRVEEFANDEAMAGRPPTGYKLVAGRSTRKWGDEGNALETLRLIGLEDHDLLTKPKIVGVPAVEKALKRLKAEAVLDKLVVKPQGKPILVPADDPRPPYRVDPASEFSAVET